VKEHERAHLDPILPHSRARHDGPVSEPPPAHLLLAVLVDELTRCGLTDACTSPGSRSTPLVLALARQPDLRCHSLLDERAAGFFALGLAKASGRPVALACTSGTAAAEYGPAVHEAHQARVPLIVLTADRPPELRDVGAGQTIDQLDLYGRAAGWFVELDALDRSSPERQRWIRTLACRLWWTAREGRPGPVHVNVPLREPLAPGVAVPRDAVLAGARPGRRPWVRRAPARREAEADAIEAMGEELDGRRRGVVVAGRAEGHPGLPDAIVRFAERAGFAVLADPLSGARRPPHAIAHYDAVLRHEPVAAALAPDVVIRVGDLPTSKPLRSWLAARGEALQIVLDADGGWQDPDGVISAALAADPVLTLDALGERLAAMTRPDPAWAGRWADADRRAATALTRALDDSLSEPRVAAELGAHLPSAAVCWLASSMPVRDAESFWPARSEPPCALSNRGANGIDGTVASALGAAAAGAGPVVALLGDLALAYDAGALIAAARLGLPVVLVVVDNDGGGIFHFLPVAGEHDVFEEHVATPHPLDLDALAALARGRHVQAATPAQLREGLARGIEEPGCTLISVASDRQANVAVHQRAWAAVGAALRDAG